MISPPRKPQKTAADYMVVALSPALIMGLVGSICFFLIEVFYQGPMGGGARWVMFWFVIAIVLVSRIAIEQSSEHAAVYGLALAAAVWLYLARMTPSYLLSIVLLGIVWFCANKLVWDCTLIDDDEDASGQGLLQKPEAETKIKSPSKTKRKRARIKFAGTLGRLFFACSAAAVWDWTGFTAFQRGGFASVGPGISCCLYGSRTGIACDDEFPRSAPVFAAALPANAGIDCVCLGEIRRRRCDPYCRWRAVCSTSGRERILERVSASGRLSLAASQSLRRRAQSPR